MILSMTGYGKAEEPFHEKKLVVELRSLNSKQLDLSMHIIPQFRDRELEIRSMLAPFLERGKVDCSIYIMDLVAASEKKEQTYSPINMDALAYYYEILSKFAKEKGVDNNNLLSCLLRLPDVTKEAAQESASDEDWELLKQTISNAVEAFLAFRKQEGKALQNMFTEKLDGIAALLNDVEPFEQGRIANIRARLEENLTILSEQTQQAIDKSRLEQEMIYYLEKLDINEEKVRLRNHIKYFRETMEGLEPSQQIGVGKKLGFIAQEMGREINTLGSKSNQSEMQILVVRMKDILEQIKEQVLNVL